MGNQFGQLFRITTFGESHGAAIGVVIDGCPANCTISLTQIQEFLDRRRPGQSALTTTRGEPDKVVCLSGLENNRTLGSPITLLVYNQDARPQDYDNLSKVYRPSHADYTMEKKYGITASSGGGRASARETIGRVAAAGVAEQILQQICPDLQVTAWVSAVKNIEFHSSEPTSHTRAQVDQSLIRCPDAIKSAEMIRLIEETKERGDSVGGQISVCISHCPVGLGEPVFDKLEADFAKAMLSLPATKSFEIGSGLAGTKMFGSEHNDEFYIKDDQVRTRTNHSGGVQGGISNGEAILLRVGFKPTSTIQKSQTSVDRSGESVTYAAQGRHDPCVLPRAVPMVEAMVSLVLVDHLLRQRGSRV